MPGASAFGFPWEKIMAIVQTVSLHDFRQAFVDMDRKDQFSYKGLEILFDYLDDLSTDVGPIELDVIGICCEYSEYHYLDIADYFNVDLSEANYNEEEELEIVLNYLHENTSVCGHDEETGMIVYAQF